MNYWFYLLITLILLLEFIEMKTHPSVKRSTHRRKSHKSSRRHKHKQLYGVSLSSITGFEKPMVPPHIINYDLPINLDQRPTGTAGVMNLDLPSKFVPLNETDQSFLIYPLQ